MTTLDDESGHNSDCDIEPDGGVSLAGHEDLMDLAGHASSINYLGGTFEQESLANVDNPALTGTATDSYSTSGHPEIESELGLMDASMSGAILFQSSSANAPGVDDAGPPAPTSIETSLHYPDPDSDLDMTQLIDSSGSAVQSNVEATIPGETGETSPDPLSSIAGFDFDSFLNDNPQMIQSIISATNPPHQPPGLLPNDIQERNNLSFEGCLHFWAEGYALQERRHPKSGSVPDPFPRFTHEDLLWGDTERVKEGTVTRSDIDEEKCDFQGVDWKAFRVDRSIARQMRRRTYFNHANVIRSYPCHQMFGSLPMYASAQDMNLDSRAKVTRISDQGKYFRFSRMSLQHRICISHFQLRHVVSASSKNAIFFPTASQEEYSQSASGSQITNVNPDVVDDSYTIDSAHIDLHCDATKMQNIYALTAKNDVLVAGGLAGEYAYKFLSSEPLAPFTSGMITRSWFSSTNHVHTYLSRHSGLPQAVFSSNDSHIHTLDLTTNKFVSRHNHVKFVNCSATSPDTRLRILVRDSTHPMIVEADSGKRIAKLAGHNDFGFACDWADDGVHFATGAQDGLVQIYDMRNWRIPVQTLLAEIGGVRSLAFSPGNGRPVLLAAESADFVHVVDASDGMFAKKQTVDFFGEIAGVTFDESGERFWVGVADPDVGGLMEFERCGEGRFERRRGWKGLRGGRRSWRGFELGMD
ncbi:MAG: hypothetical protein Q9186_002455 [Xanthomendoza sp. 1 TL-2023]